MDERRVEGREEGEVGREGFGDETCAEDGHDKHDGGNTCEEDDDDDDDADGEGNEDHSNVDDYKGSDDHFSKHMCDLNVASGHTCSEQEV